MQGKVTPLILQTCKINPPPRGPKGRVKETCGGGGVETSSLACGVNILRISKIFFTVRYRRLGERPRFEACTYLTAGGRGSHLATTHPGLRYVTTRTVSKPNHKLSYAKPSKSKVSKPGCFREFYRVFSMGLMDKPTLRIESS